jgi:hypothetical protein
MRSFFIATFYSVSKALNVLARRFQGKGGARPAAWPAKHSASPNQIKPKSQIFCKIDDLINLSVTFFIN